MFLFLQQPNIKQILSQTEETLPKPRSCLFLPPSGDLDFKVPFFKDEFMK